MLDIHKILATLPHRYPILLVDRVLELEKGKRIKALKNVSVNEPYFMGHFPHRPVMPGVLMLEAMAQAAALLVFDMLDVVPEARRATLWWLILRLLAFGVLPLACVNRWTRWVHFWGLCWPSA